jgi:pimeloyl-ACP methyl ester carboxylesterase
MQIEWTRFQTVARDGVRLSIARVAPRYGGSRGAVVLQHGLGANGIAFSCPGVSLAQHLAESGYDCYVPDLRGAGQSQLPATGWTIDEYLEYDIPAILAAAQHSSGHALLHWVGHSMGGILMLMYGIERPDAPIARLCTVGSGLDYRACPNVYQRLRHLRPLLGLLPTLPFAAISSTASRVAGIGPVLPTEGMSFYRPNIDRTVCRDLMARGFSPIPVTLFDSLATTFEEGGFSRSRGRITYLSRAREFRIPTLLLAGTKDVQCPPAMAEATCALLGSTEKQLRIFGRAHGHAEEYGHFDLLVGRRSRVEVWPTITAFLAADEVGENDTSRFLSA